MTNRQLTNSNFDSINPDINGSVIVYQRKFDNGNRSGIYVYNLRSEKELLISDSNFDAQLPKVSADKIVWQQWDGNDWEIWSSGIDGSDRTQLTRNELDDTTPVVDGNLVLFQRKVNRIPTSNLSDLYIYDFNTSLARSIATSSTRFNSLGISDSNLVWEESGSSSIITATINNSTIDRTILNIRGSIISQPSIDNNIVVFRQQRVENNSTLIGLNYYNINSDTYFNLIGNNLSDPQRENPEISDNNVVWQQLTGNNNWEIWTKPVNSSVSTRITNNDLEDINPEISSKNVVWQRFDGSNYEIFYDSLIGLSDPIYRFYNPTTGGHFYTASTSEKDSLLSQNNSGFNYEGIAFFASSSADNRLDPVYRFYNPLSRLHFYTINQGERDQLINNPQYGYVAEGIGFYAYTDTISGVQDVYRFHNTITGAHFFTISTQERDTVLNNPQWGYVSEGVAFRAA